MQVLLALSLTLSACLAFVAVVSLWSRHQALETAKIQTEAAAASMAGAQVKLETADRKQRQARELEARCRWETEQLGSFLDQFNPQTMAVPRLMDMYRVTHHGSDQGYLGGGVPSEAFSTHDLPVYSWATERDVDALQTGFIYLRSSSGSNHSYAIDGRMLSVLRHSEERITDMARGLVAQVLTCASDSAYEQFEQRRAR